MTLDKNEFDLFLAFAVRHKRFLKTRETSFTPKKLTDGCKTVEKSVKAIQVAAKKLGGTLHECINDPKKKSKLVRELRSKVTRLTPAQAETIVTHAESFHMACQTLLAQGKPVLKVKKAAEFGDRYYQPVEHKYR